MTTPNPHAAALGKLGGKAKSAAKTAAARANGRKGGRPSAIPSHHKPDDRRLRLIGRLEQALEMATAGRLDHAIRLEVSAALLELGE